MKILSFLSYYEWTMFRTEITCDFTLLVRFICITRFFFNTRNKIIITNRNNNHLRININQNQCIEIILESLSPVLYFLIFGQFCSISFFDKNTICYTLLLSRNFGSVFVDLHMILYKTIPNWKLYIYMYTKSRSCTCKTNKTIKNEVNLFLQIQYFLF